MGKSFIRTIVNAARDHLFLWRSRCITCHHRLPEFVDGQCFDCRIRQIERRTWDPIIKAIEQFLRGYKLG